MRNGADQLRGTEVEGDDSVCVKAAAGDASPVTKGDYGSPVGHGSMRIGGDVLLECQERLSIVMSGGVREGEGKNKEEMKRKKRHGS